MRSGSAPELVSLAVGTLDLARRVGVGLRLGFLGRLLRSNWDTDDRGRLRDNGPRSHRHKHGHSRGCTAKLGETREQGVKDRRRRGWVV